MDQITESRDKGDNLNSFLRILRTPIKHTNRSQTKVLVEWGIILFVALLFCFAGLLDFNPNYLQQSGEQNESATRPLLAEIGLKRYGEIPLWNPYMQTGFPHVGDMMAHFWSPIATLPVLIWGGIVGMKVSIFLTFLLAGYGQWYLANVIGVKGLFRLWSALMFMVSGGLALLWRVGWYELLLGIVWFPWVFASYWQALSKKDIRSLVLTAVCVGMVLTTGGGYYPFYLLFCALTILSVCLVIAETQQRIDILKRSILIAILGLGLIAVVVLPICDGYRLTMRIVSPDMKQVGSQPVHYALINYVVSAPDWFRATILGTSGGWNWFYIGPLSLGSLVFLPSAFHAHRKRAGLWAILCVFIVLLLWHSNRFSVFKYIYDWFPFLYQLRFPNRLLILATSPLLVLSSASLQAAYTTIRKKIRGYRFSFSNNKNNFTFSGRRIVTLLTLLILALSFRDVYTTNQEAAMPVSMPLEPKAYTALRWLKHHDPGLYYTSVGTFAVFWSWTPVAYDLEMPVLNFVYSQRLRTQENQLSPYAPFAAQPKYQFLRADEPLPDNAQLLREFDGINLWYFPDALPFAFLVPEEKLETGQKVTKKDIKAVSVSYDGPNRLVVSDATADEDHQLVVLVSDYPGWRIIIDGKPSELTTINYYLSVRALPGNHTYTFTFQPTLYYIGLMISIGTVVLMVVLVVRERHLSRQSI